MSLGLPRNSPVFRTERQLRENMSLEERKERLLLRETKDTERSRRRQKEIDATIEAVKSGIYSPPPPPKARPHSPLSGRRTPGRSTSPVYRMSPPSPSARHMALTTPISHSSTATSEADDLRNRIQHLRKSLDQSARISPSPDFPPTKSSSPERARQRALDSQTDRVRKLAQQEVQREVETLRTQISTITYQSQQLDKQNKSLRNDNDLLQSQADMLKRQLNDERINNTAAEATMRASLEAQKREIQRLGSQERATDKSEVDKLKEDLMQAMLDHAKEKETIATEAQMLVNTATQERCKMEVRLSELGEQVTALNEEAATLRTTVSALEEELALHRAESNEKSREIEQLKKSAAAAATAAAQAREKEVPTQAPPQPREVSPPKPEPVPILASTSPVPVDAPVHDITPVEAPASDALQVHVAEKVSTVQRAKSFVWHCTYGAVLLAGTLFLALAALELLTEIPVVSAHYPTVMEYYSYLHGLWVTRRWPATVEAAVVAWVAMWGMGVNVVGLGGHLLAGSLLLGVTLLIAMALLDAVCETEIVQEMENTVKGMTTDLDTEFNAYVEHRNELAVAAAAYISTLCSNAADKAVQLYNDLIAVLTSLYEKAVAAWEEYTKSQPEESA